MIKKLPFLMLFIGCFAFAQDPLFDAFSTISPHGSVSSPANEGYPKIIDGDIETKFLDFNYWDGLGFTVNLNGYQTVATGLEVITANDYPERDPTIFQIYGSNNGTSFTSITTGNIVCDTERFYSTYYEFDNEAGYSYYRLVFSTQCNPIEGMIQIAEVQLYGTELGNDTFSKRDEVKLYPNPNNGRFTIRHNEPIGQIVIADALGKTIQQIYVETDSYEMNLQGVASGLYFLKTSNGGTKKIVIK